MTTMTRPRPARQPRPGERDSWGRELRWYSHDVWFVGPSAETAGQTFECPVCGGRGWVTRNSAGSECKLWCRDAVAEIRRVEAALREYREWQADARMYGRWS